MTKCARDECTNLFEPRDKRNKYCCNLCRVREKIKRDRIRNPGRAKAATRKWSHANAEYERLRCRIWYGRNKEAVSEYNRKYKESNWPVIKERLRIQRIKRRADYHRIDSFQIRLTARDWLDIVKRSGGKCFYCGKKARPVTQDHLVPISKGGGHVAGNVVVACTSCNSSKGTQDWKSFLMSKV